MKRYLQWLPFFLAVAIAAVTMTARTLRDRERKRMAEEVPGKDPSLVLVTGYCNCGKCCGWRRNRFGFGEPVYDYGKTKGRPKRIGITATGTIDAATKYIDFEGRVASPFATAFAEQCHNSLSYECGRLGTADPTSQCILLPEQ